MNLETEILDTRQRAGIKFSHPRRGSGPGASSRAFVGHADSENGTQAFGGKTMKRLIRFWQKPLALGIIALLLAPLTIWGDNGPAHRVDQAFPIQLGTSGGNITDRSSAFCCSGTLGALVQNVAGTQHILSNNHVLARTNLASTGEDIIQPGLIDQNPVCAMDTTDAVADLSAFVPILFKTKSTTPTNTVDAAIAEVRADAVNSQGSILDIGVPSSATVAPSLGLAVKKSGRTTGLTTGAITAVNVTVDVTYSKKCGTGSQTARFVGQFLVGPGGFSSGGDSGSVIVENVATAPPAVGLLFAGSSTVTAANPIQPVLNAFSVTMVGSSSASLWNKMVTFARKLVRVPESQAQLPEHVNPAAVDAVTRVKERHEGRLLSIPGVVGVGVGLSTRVTGPVIEIYVKEATEALRRALPSSLEGVHVEIVETGEIFAR